MHASRKHARREGSLCPPRGSAWFQMQLVSCRGVPSGHRAWNQFARPTVEAPVDTLHLID